MVFGMAGTLPPKFDEIITNNELRQWNKEISTNDVKKKMYRIKLQYL